VKSPPLWPFPHYFSFHPELATIMNVRQSFYSFLFLYKNLGMYLQAMCIVLFICLMLGIRPLVSGMLSKHSPTSQPMLTQFYCFIVLVKFIELICVPVFHSLSMLYNILLLNLYQIVACQVMNVVKSPTWTIFWLLWLLSGLLNRSYFESVSKKAIFIFNRSVNQLVCYLLSIIFLMQIMDCFNSIVLLISILPNTE
jgi:hypothetical protein